MLMKTLCVAMAKAMVVFDGFSGSNSRMASSSAHFLANTVLFSRLKPPVRRIILGK